MQTVAKKYGKVYKKKVDKTKNVEEHTPDEIEYIKEIQSKYEEMISMNDKKINENNIVWEILNSDVKVCFDVDYDEFVIDDVELEHLKKYKKLRKEHPNINTAYVKQPDDAVCIFYSLERDGKVVYATSKQNLRKAIRNTLYFASENKGNEAKYNIILNQFDGQPNGIVGKTLAYFKGGSGTNVTDLLIKKHCERNNIDPPKKKKRKVVKNTKKNVML